MKTRRPGAMSASWPRHAWRASAPPPRPRPRGPARRPGASLLPDQAERLERPAQGRGAAPDPDALGRRGGVFPQGRVVPLRHQPGQRLPLAADRRPAAAPRLGRAATLLAGRLEPGGERPLAYRVEPRDLGLATLASF